jgi:hypothetical protein
MNPVHIIAPYFVNIHFNIVLYISLSLRLFVSDLQTKILFSILKSSLGTEEEEAEEEDDDYDDLTGLIVIVIIVIAIITTTVKNAAYNEPNNAVEWLIFLPYIHEFPVHILGWRPTSS